MKLEITRIENGFVVTRASGWSDTTWYCKDKKELDTRLKILIELL